MTCTFQSYSRSMQTSKFGSPESSVGVPMERPGQPAEYQVSSYPPPPPLLFPPKAISKRRPCSAQTRSSFVSCSNWSCWDVLSLYWHGLIPIERREKHLNPRDWSRCWDQLEINVIPDRHLSAIYHTDKRQMFWILFIASIGASSIFGQWW